MTKPTLEEIDALLECAKVVGGNFARLADAYRAMALEAKMLERQYAYLAETVRHGDVAAEDVQAIIKRHTAERKALK